MSVGERILVKCYEREGENEGVMLHLGLINETPVSAEEFLVSLQLLLPHKDVKGFIVKWPVCVWGVRTPQPRSAAPRSAWPPSGAAQRLLSPVLWWQLSTAQFRWHTCRIPCCSILAPRRAVGARFDLWPKCSFCKCLQLRLQNRDQVLSMPLN